MAVTTKEISEQEFTATFAFVLTRMQMLVHDNAKDHGWWDRHPHAHNDGEKLALMHSEISEALEALRVGNPMSEKDGLAEVGVSCVEEELADCVIRILDYAQYKGFNLARAVLLKHEYNKSRPHRHGGKQF